MGADKTRNEINRLYYESGCCPGHHALPGTEIDLPVMDFEKLVHKALNNIYKRRGNTSGYVDPALFTLNNDTLQKGIDKTFSSAGIEFGKRNKDFMSQFKNNTAVFAAFKSHTESRELAKLLINEKGNLRSFHEFSRMAEPIIGDYNRTWLKTEHETVVRSARMAANWKKFEERKHIFPNLEFMKSRARNKRENHLKWVGTILPMDHPWWQTHTPPIAWGCECWIRQTRAQVTGVPDDDTPVPEVFRNNPGITAEPIVISKHPYVINAEINRQQIDQFISENFIRKYEYVRHEVQSEKGYLYIHSLADQKKAETSKTIGMTLANLGHKVRLLPDIQPDNKKLRDLLMPDGIKPNKNPDALIGSRIFEFKTLEKNTYNAISQELRYAGNQADHVLLNIRGYMDETIINRAIRGRVKLKKNIRQVWIMKDGYVKKYDRDFILSDKFGKKSEALY